MVWAAGSGAATLHPTSEARSVTIRPSLESEFGQHVAHGCFGGVAVEALAVEAFRQDGDQFAGRVGVFACAELCEVPAELPTQCFADLAARRWRPPR